MNGMDWYNLLKGRIKLNLGRINANLDRNWSKIGSNSDVFGRIIVRSGRIDSD
ncbi:hypothetical protein V6B33_02220 [Mangrovibacillus sp. Mu-81]|jgi:hypothetical protein|uniref:hypothetical protein n=1 Tax=Mangrovibacillus sp. Mu-81 TaxID=3121478 RepID=UPI002FE444F9